MRLLLAAVLLGGGFGAASADVSSVDGDVMVIDIEVEVEVSAQSVVAHLSFDQDPELKLPLLDRGGGIFGVVTELDAKNYVVVFEALGDESESSIPVTLAQLGADLLSGADPTTTTSEPTGISPENQRMLWLAIAAGAASLSVLAFWVLGGKEKGEPTDPTDEAE